MTRGLRINQFNFVSEIEMTIRRRAKVVKVALAEADKNRVEATGLLRKVSQSHEFVSELACEYPWVRRRLWSVGAKDAAPVCWADDAAYFKGKRVAVEVWLRHRPMSLTCYHTNPLCTIDLHSVVLCGM